MKLFFSMIHHNPSEPLIESKYNDPFYLKEVGYNAQVLTNINLMVSYKYCCPELVRKNREVMEWITNKKIYFDAISDKIVNSGLHLYSHIDLLLIPKVIVEHYKTEMMENGKISIYREKTREIVEAMLKEVFDTYPKLEGLIIRVGEIYLYSTPYHTGNCPIIYFLDQEHNFANGDISVNYTNRDRDLEREKKDFVYLIDFLKEIVCKRYGKKLIFRTWDYFKDRFHSSSEYYLDITDRIEPNEFLYFSLKHTRFDYFRYAGSNPSIGLGKHKQVIEVQFQREYEGKGAYPNYFAHYLINGFPETSDHRGFKDFIQSPLVEGIFAWPRGGGWYGPYIKNEFWIDLNLHVFMGWIKNPSLNEETIFYSFLEELGFDNKSRNLLREIALLSSDAVLKGRYCKYDRVDILWMRDDVIGGLNQLGKGLKRLNDAGMLDAALEEKRESVKLWEKIVHLASDVTHRDSALVEYIRISCLYGLYLYKIVEKGWKILSGKVCNRNISNEDIEKYREAWEKYRDLERKSSLCPSLYRGKYWNWPGERLTPGMDDSVDQIVLEQSNSD